jgi:hypothetical protein
MTALVAGVIVSWHLGLPPEHFLNKLSEKIKNYFMNLIVSENNKETMGIF